MTVNLVISFDFELGWGVLDTPEWYKREKNGLYEKVREVLPRLIQKLEERQIPTSWGVVGSMFDEGELDLEHLPVAYKEKIYSFIKNAKQTTKSAIDTVELFYKIDNLVEFGSHTSTHLYAKTPGVTAENYINDVRISMAQIPKEFLSEIPFLIFPRDQSDFRNELAKEFQGLNYRMNPRDIYDSKLQMHAFFGLGRIFLGPRKSLCVRGNNNERIHSGSFYFNYFGENFEILKKVLFHKDVSVILNEKEDITYHIWLHPFNLAESKKVFEAFLRFLDKAADLRDTGLVNFYKMTDYENRI